MKTFVPHIERAIGLHGSQAKLAKEMGCSQQYISWLLKDAEQISGDMAVAVERATQGAVSRSDLRPDLFVQSQAGTAA
jgi:DNA-binding transcriptional regulator YdaS (Cro superfamily)